MKSLRTLFTALSLFLLGSTLTTKAELVWKAGEALITNASQITANSSENGFPTSNLLRPESDGVGQNQYIWHTSWSNPGCLPPNTDPYLQVHLNKAEKDIIFSMLGTTWGTATDTPTEIIIQAANLPDGEWTIVKHLTEMQNDFTEFAPDRYTSPRIALGAEYTDLRFVVKKTVHADKANRYDNNGNPFVALGRFQVYRAVETEVTPVEPEKKINLLFIGNSITAGATTSSPSTQAPPVICRNLVKEATGLTTNLYNGGHSGITTVGFLPGTTDFTNVVNSAKTFYKNNGGLTYFSIMLGTNDSSYGSAKDGGPLSLEEYKSNLKTIINGLIAAVPTCKILLNYPIWYSPNTYNGAKYLQEGLDRLQTFYPIIDEVSEEYEQVIAGNRAVWEYFENNKTLFTQENGNAGVFQLHPSAVGASRLGEIWAKSLLEIIAADGVEIKNPLPEWNVFKPAAKKYTIATPRGFYGTNGDVVTNTVKTDIEATTGEFAFVPYGDNLYIYSIADKKFLYRNPTPYRDDWSNIQLSESYFEPFKVHYVGSKEEYPYCLAVGEYIANVASSTAYGVVLNTWATNDDGNRIAIVETGDYDISEPLQILDDYFSNQLTVTYRVEDADGNLLEEFTAIGQTGDIITEIPAQAPRRAYTAYTVAEPVTLVKGQDNVVRVTATWDLPFELSPSLQEAKWYNLRLYGGEDYVNSEGEYKCNNVPTKEDAVTDAYQWAFQGNPYEGIIVYNRADITKTLAKVGDRAILAEGVYRWQISEHEDGFLLANNEDGKYINAYGGSGGYLGFYNVGDAGSIFSVSEVGVMTVDNIRLEAGGAIKLFKSSDDNANGRAILIIPGGGYSYVSGVYEGTDWVPFFNDLGYTAAILHYTTPPTSHDGPLTQAREAMRFLREHAEEYNVTTGQIGVIGFSAGGHLASTVATHTRGDEVPAFQILFYPVITMNSSYTHSGSRENLLGKKPSSDLIELYSNEKQVTEDTPRAYVCWADDDGVVPPRNSTSYVIALKKCNVPYHTKRFDSGGHGFAFKTSFKYHTQMVKDLTTWMEETDAVLSSIETATKDKDTDTVYYNLLGQRVSNPQNGIFVTNGKKVVFKR